jgi:hypothetical protein
LFLTSTRRHAVYPQNAAHGGPVTVATTLSDIIQIGRLRYDLYVGRDGKQYRHADHLSRQFLEPIDAVSFNFQAKRNDILLGSVRGSLAVDALHDAHLLPLVETASPRCLHEAVVSSRFAVHPSNTARSLISELFREVYRTGIGIGAKQCLVSTRDDLVPLFARFGFRSIGKKFTDPVAGPLNVLIHEMKDIDYMRHVGSPLLSVIDGHAQLAQTSDEVFT